MALPNNRRIFLPPPDPVRGHTINTIAYDDIARDRDMWGTNGWATANAAQDLANHMDREALANMQELLRVQARRPARMTLPPPIIREANIDIRATPDPNIADAGELMATYVREQMQQEGFARRILGRGTNQTGVQSLYTPTKGGFVTHPKMPTDPIKREAWLRRNNYIKQLSAWKSRNLLVDQNLANTHFHKLKMNFRSIEIELLEAINKGTFLRTKSTEYSPLTNTVSLFGTPIIELDSSKCVRRVKILGASDYLKKLSRLRLNQLNVKFKSYKGRNRLRISENSYMEIPYDTMFEIPLQYVTLALPSGYNVVTEKEQLQHEFIVENLGLPDLKTFKNWVEKYQPVFGYVYRGDDPFPSGIEGRVLVNSKVLTATTSLELSAKINSMSIKDVVKLSFDMLVAKLAKEINETLYPNRSPTGLGIRSGDSGRYTVQGIPTGQQFSIATYTVNLDYNTNWLATNATTT